MKCGEVYYINLGSFAEEGSEQRAGRPAVIVSNDHCNETSSVVEVVYLTTQNKPDMPTHVTVRATGRTSTVLCEQICSVSKNRIGGYAGECTDIEMERIDIALMESLGLDYGYCHDHDEDDYEDGENYEAEPEQERDYEGCFDDEQFAEIAKALIRVEAERDTYKDLYENLLAKMICSQSCAK